MKAFYHDKLTLECQEVAIRDDQVHHFSHVLRGKVGETVLLLNGKGLCCQGKVKGISKKIVALEVCSREFVKSEQVEVAIGIPKKDYLTSVLRSCTEIGVRTIHLITMDYTNGRLSPLERLEKIMITALTQSNAPYLPVLYFHNSLKDFLTHNHESSKNALVAFTTELAEYSKIKGFKKTGKPNCALIGPEGGYSEQELNLLMSEPNVELVKLRNPIMKTITAVPFCLGYLQ